MKPSRHYRFLLAAVLFATGLVGSGMPADSNEATRLVGKPVSLALTPPSIRLSGPRARQQLLVTGQYSDGSRRDLTRLVEFHPATPGRIAIDANGRITGISNATTHFDVHIAGLTARVPVTVEDLDTSQDVSFRREVMPVLSATGCADIRCHGAPSGKSGFRLSLWGHDPDLDFAQLTRDVSGRRTNPLAPNESLIIRKALTRTPHVGGRRFSEDSELATILKRWQAQGRHDDVEPVNVVSLTVTPPRRVLHAPARHQQLAVVATFDDGRVTDATHLTTFSSTDIAVATVNRSGLVRFKRQGEVAILCRFCGSMESVRLLHIQAPPANYRWTSPPENNFVDTHVFSKLKMLHLNPSRLTTDEEFVRRVHLDICGVLPTVQESQKFAASIESDKRARLVDRLLQRPEYADYWSKKWLDVLRVSRDSIQLAGARAYHKWLRSRIEEDAPFDVLARDMLTSVGESYKDPASNFYCVPRTPEKVTDPLYLQKDLAEATAQLFLGIRLQCAQCHNHPYERWTQDDYLALAAFFTQVKRDRLGKAGRKGRPDRRQMKIAVDFNAKEITNESTGSTIRPGFPGESKPTIDAQKDRRPILANWLTDPENPFFARAVVNRVWFHFHGRGIVEPVDDFRDSNPSANDALLDALATDFVATGYRLKPLIQTIVNSRTYQLSSHPNDSNRNDQRYFSHMTPRPLPAEVLLDAVTDVTELPEQFEITKDYIEGIPDGVVSFPLGTRAVQLPVNDVATLINTQGKYVRYELHPFLRVFGQPNGTETCECARESTFGRKQALELFVGQLLSDRIADANNVLAGLMQAYESDSERLDVLYQRALSRSPSRDTSDKLLSYISNTGNKREAWEDILWTVLNSQEFIYQH